MNKNEWTKSENVSTGLLKIDIEGFDDNNPTTTDILMSTYYVDGEKVTSDAKILVKSQTSAAENGFYDIFSTTNTVTSGAATSALIYYKAEDIIIKKSSPSIIGKYAVNGEKYSIAQFSEDF